MRRKIALNFALPQRAISGGAKPFGLALLLAGMGLAGWLAWTYQNLAQRADTLELKVERMRHLVGKTSFQTEDIPETLTQETRFAAEALSQALTPWSDLFEALESAKDERIALLSLQPNAHKREIRISGEAQDFSALIEYRERLASGKALYDVQLTSHQVLQNVPQQPVRFDLIASWKTPA